MVALLVRYYDREGRSITHRRWSKLLRDAKYSILNTMTNALRQVTCSWVGVASVDEDPPLIFLVQEKGRVRQKGADEYRESQPGLWYATEREAMVAYIELTEGVG